MKAVRSSAKLMFARRRKLLVCLFLFCLQDAFGAAPPMPPFKYDRPDCLVHRLGTGREDGLTERNYQQVVASAPAIMIDIATRVGCYVVELRGGGPNLNVSFDNLLTGEIFLPSCWNQRNYWIFLCLFLSKYGKRFRLGQPESQGKGFGPLDGQSKRNATCPKCHI